jgi:hypothetical protein
MDGEAIIMSINEELKINDPGSFMGEGRLKTKAGYVHQKI